ncbi:hypothetical protein Despr_0086 [Desulfobulbus propionicus DSM 2032]|jgi:hypothetical protein|uniref:Uncharacterized protein n=1 Tax=Desulfobulbus propionicus (strain ATCC 33891 / DSM 2032 / VKM B-1956 / 1pr3) TaxID=577650 RepID=A0A7U3YIZ5_DESPD|nr:hypothetical protein [Desulfobulbus propionicus]ADW16280.1 hypothetical protein Despr_0086 [Desulfobulbus propionicus DSM 2032]
MTRRIGIVGVPPLAVIEEINRQGDHIVDLDEPQVRAPIDQTASRIPRVYCAILRTVVLNCLHLALDRVYIDVGPGKCDCALHVAEILADMLPIPVIRTRNQDTRPFGNPLCTSRMPLMEKFSRITQGVQSAAAYPPLEPCPPSCGFWGVPPRDFSLLAPFPDTTHVFGWTRCMENKTPSDFALEQVVDPTIPTVFFSQSFCAKSALAKHLAAKHPRALAIDCDVSVSSSTRAKIEAFLELSGIDPQRGNG